MFVEKKKKICFVSIAALVIFTAILNSHLKSYFIDSLRWPLEFFSQISREVQGIIIYHQNLVENRQFRKEIGLIRRQLYETEELYFENVRLRKLLNFKEKSVYPLTVAGVVGHDPSNLSSIIIIDKGKRQGIVGGCAVITNGGLVGRVVQAGSQTSKVLLINDINSGVAALIQRSRQKGLVSGTLARGVTLQYLLPDADIQISDLVITSGLSGLYPKGILIGKVIKIQEEVSRGEIFAVIQPSANLTKLEEVLVVLATSEKPKH